MRDENVDYCKLFSSAIRRTSILFPDTEVSDSLQIANLVKQEYIILLKLLGELFSKPEYESIIPGECINTHQYLYGIITEVIKKRYYLTVGSVIFKNEELFTFSEREVGRIPYDPQLTKFPGHVWISDESGMILDGSLKWAIRYHLRGERNPPMIDLNPSHLADFKYVPYLAGNANLIGHLVSGDAVIVCAE